MAAQVNALEDIPSRASFASCVERHSMPEDRDEALQAAEPSQQNDAKSQRSIESEDARHPGLHGAGFNSGSIRARHAGLVARLGGTPRATKRSKRYLARRRDSWLP